MAQTTVKVLVGESATVFEMDCALLMEKSEWFHAALNPQRGFQEANTRTVRLVDYEPIAFQHCQLWMQYEVFKPKLQWTWKELAMTWILADQLRLEGMGNEIIKAFVDRHWRETAHSERKEQPRNWAAGGSNISASTMHYIFNNTYSKCVLRELFTYFFLDTRAIDPWLGDIDDYPESFASTMKVSFKHIKWAERPHIRSYHDVDKHCGTTLTTNPELNLQSGFRCTGFHCRHRGGSPADSFIRGPVYLCRFCPDAMLCSDCREDPSCKGRAPDPDEVTEEHNLFEHWPTHFIQYRTVCSSKRCAENPDMVDDETGYIIGTADEDETTEAWIRQRYYCWRCDQTFCFTCGQDPENLKKAGNRCSTNELTGQHQLKLISGPRWNEYDLLGRDEQYRHHLPLAIGCTKCGQEDHETNDCAEPNIITPCHPRRED